MKNYLNWVLFLIFFMSVESFAGSCQEVRMGLDIGSGSTKMMVAKVDFCKNNILEVLHKESYPVAYNEDLEKSTDGSLSPVVIELGLTTLSKMMAKGKTFKPKKIRGVGTSVFRKSKNGIAVIKQFARQLGARIEVISQEEEAKLGYLSALAQMDEKNKEKNIVVWDIGGGSMQMFSIDKNKIPRRYLGDLAAVTFKNMVIEVIQSKSLESTISPNPIGGQRGQVVALARAYSRIHVPSEIKDDLKERMVVGVGGVHGQSLKNQLVSKGTTYTLDELDKAGLAQSLKNDKELGGDYSSTDVTNLLLVQGFMEGLGIKQVNIVDATLLQGVMLK